MADDEVKQLVKEMLLEEASSDDPMSSREISTRLEEDEVGSFPKTRMIIRGIMVRDKVPVVSNNQGYWVAESDDEIYEYIEDLDNRITGIAQRRYAIMEAAELWDGEEDLGNDFL